MTKTSFLALVALLLWSATVRGQVPEEICLSEEEMMLYTLIDNARKGSQLHKVALSPALCYVAKLHAMDLQHNRESGETCSIHSWTDKAEEWDACCYESGDADKVTCMYNKPREIAGYGGNGYEIITVGAADPQAAMSDWQANSSLYGAVIVNTGDWSGFNWEAVGVAIYQDYTVVWFGEVTDKSAAPKLCSEGSFVPDVSFLKKEEPVAEVTDDIPPPERINEPIKVSVSGEGDLIALKAGYTYLIYGSYSDLENARKGRDLLKADGFQDVHIIKADANGMYRITIGEYKDEQIARQTKAGLQTGYENVWLLIN